MASIRKRRNKFNVVYYYTNDQGERKQKWEPFDTEEEAKTRKAEIEYKMKVNTFIARVCPKFCVNTAGQCKIEPK